jgi:hypothetical protein
MPGPTPFLQTDSTHFTNDPKLALEDLKKQLGELDAVLCEKLFPTPRALSLVEELARRFRRGGSSDGDQSDNTNELSIPLPGEQPRRRTGIEFPPGNHGHER